MKIKYPLNEGEKNRIRERLDEILAKTEGEQVIILMNENLISDYYQNVEGEKILKRIEESAREFSGLAKDLISF